MHLPLTRRTFVLGGLAAASHALAQGGPRRLRLGFLGTAHSHFRGKLAVVKRSPDFELVGACDEDPERRRQGPPDVPWLDPEALLGQCDVIAVESAVEDHARHARLALEAGCQVHVEKPPATSLKDLRRLFRLAEQRQCRLQVGYMWRHNPGLQAVFEAVREGWLGQVLQVRAAIPTSIDDAERAKSIRFRGGILFELGCHLIDPVVRLLGRPERVVSSLLRSGVRPDPLADNAVAILEYARAVATVSSTALQTNAGAHRFFEVIGTRGSARVQPLEPPVLHLDLAEPAGPHPAGRHEVTFPPYARYVDEFATLARTIRDGTALPVTPADELIVHETLLKACRMD